MKQDTANVNEEKLMDGNTMTETTEQDNQNVELNIQDLQNLKEIIDVASARGAFRPKEMMAVGSVYNKLENFLMAVAAQQKQGE